jgi:hypothetical protein
VREALVLPRSRLPLRSSVTRGARQIGPRGNVSIPSITPSYVESNDSALYVPMASWMALMISSLPVLLTSQQQHQLASLSQAGGHQQNARAVPCKVERGASI